MARRCAHLHFSGGMAFAPYKKGGVGRSGGRDDAGSGYVSLARSACTRARTSTVSAALSGPAFARNCSKWSIAR